MADRANQPTAPTTALTVQQRAGALANQTWTRFRGLDPPRRHRLLAAAVGLLASLAVLLWWAGRTDWRTLCAGLEPDDARTMAQQLTTAGIPFDLSVDGTALRVPAPDLDKARLATTAKGGPRSGRMGFELFDKPNWMGSEFDEKVNYQRALEGELEHTIATMADVQAARVHLVLPHDSLFSEDQRDAKASVVLRLRHRTLSDDEAAAIENLVASAVDGLRPENVVLVDAEGGGLLGRRSGQGALDARQQALAARLVATLEPVAGVGNVRASVNVDYDANSADELDETYDPAQTATLSTQKTDRTSGQPPASGIPGTVSNAPNAASKPPLYPPTTAAAETLKEESDTYAVSKKVRHTIEAPGRVRRLTAAILINYQQTGQGKAAQWQPRPADEMQRLTLLAQSAVGFDATRGDQVSVEQLPFDENLAPPPSLSERMLVTASTLQPWLRFAGVVLGLAVFVLFVARPALRSLTGPPRPQKAARNASSKAAAGPIQPATLPPESDLPVIEKKPPDPRRLRAQSVYETVAENVKKDPQQTSRLLESWIHSE